MIEIFCFCFHLIATERYNVVFKWKEVHRKPIFVVNLADNRLHSSRRKSSSRRVPALLPTTKWHYLRVFKVLYTFL